MLAAPPPAKQASSPRDYAALDAGLVRWQADMAALTQQAGSMAVVGLQSNTESSLELEFNK